MLRVLAIVFSGFLVSFGLSACGNDSSTGESSDSAEAADWGWWRPVDFGTYEDDYCDFAKKNPAKGVSGFASGCWVKSGGSWVYDDGLMLAVGDPQCKQLTLAVLPNDKHDQEISVTMLKSSAKQSVDAGEFAVPSGGFQPDDVVPIELPVPKGGAQFKLDFANTTPHPTNGNELANIVSSVKCS